MFCNILERIILPHCSKRNVTSSINSFKWMSSKKLAYSQCTTTDEFRFSNYDCIGFDLDHTLCRYKLNPLFNLIYKTLASFLVEKYDYPKYLINVNENEMTFAQKGVVLDKRRGNFLKLDEQYRIVRASHGTRQMSADEIQDVYGMRVTWEETKRIPRDAILSGYLDETYYIFKDYFVTPGALICAKMIDIADQQRPGNQYTFWEHYIEGIFYMYERYNFRDDRGVFYPNLKRHPDVYFQQCSDQLKHWLAAISKSKVTFLLTSSNYDSAEFIAQHCLGPDWKKFFDVIITFARKPGFFWKDLPFLPVDGNGEGNTCVDPMHIQGQAVYSQGNFKGLQEVCARLSGVSCPKIAYFGDSLIEDVYAASDIAGCDSIAIVEEMLAEGMDNCPHLLHSESSLLTSEYWGSFFGGGVEGTASLWARLLSKYSRLRIPSLENVCKIQLHDSVPCSWGEALTQGYYPGVPKALVTSSDEQESVGMTRSMS